MQAVGHASVTATGLGVPATPAPAAPMTLSFSPPVPILRSFDEAKAREFYCDFLGFSIDFEHRFAPDLPLYLGLSRGAFALHLSEHHGDASPGATLHVPMMGITVFQQELLAKTYRYGRPGIVSQPYGQEMTVYDPFGNRIRFVQKPSVTA